MITHRIDALLAGILALLTLLCGCQTGPNAADVAADRARWNAVHALHASDQVRMGSLREALADGQISEEDKLTIAAAYRSWDSEDPLLGELLIAWDDQLSADERAAGEDRVAEQWRSLLRVYGVALVQEFVVPILQQQAPQVFALLDKDGDGTLSVEELLGLDPTSPVTAMVVVQTIHQLIRRRP